MNMDPVKYLNTTVWARLGPSVIHGVGVFAIRDIPKGTQITDFNLNDFRNQRPLRINYKDFEKILPEIRALILDYVTFLYHKKIPEFSFFSPNQNACLQSFMNHSDKPNSDGVWSLKAIKKGEEITENYRDLLHGNVAHEVMNKHRNFPW